jgi:5-methylcytosine-specific restriction endonuclease McrA
VLLDLSKKTDNDLIARTKTLRNTEHESMTEILQHLIETEKRRLDLDLGYSSLFDYCVNYLEYSGPAAGRRIQAARCIRQFPIVLSMLENHELSLSKISQIEGILTDDNYKSILERVKGASYRKVEEIACEYRAPIKFRDRVKPVCVAVRASDPSNVGARADAHGASMKKMMVQFLADEELVKKFEEAKALLSSGNPNVSFADVMEVLVNEYLERHSPVARQARREERKRAASPDSRRREWNDTTKSRHVPDDVRDDVFARDQGQCAYVAPDGKRCQSTHGLQIDHIRPFATGGGHDAKNLRLLCGAHNRRAAETAMGGNVMAQYWRSGGGRGGVMTTDEHTSR